MATYTEKRLATFNETLSAGVDKVITVPGGGVARWLITSFRFKASGLGASETLTVKVGPSATPLNILSATAVGTIPNANIMGTAADATGHLELLESSSGTRLGSSSPQPPVTPGMKPTNTLILETTDEIRLSISTGSCVIEGLVSGIEVS